MKKRLTTKLTTVVIAASLMSVYAASAIAADAPSAAAGQQTIPSYALTDSLDVQVKSVVNERVPDGTRIGVVVKMRNKGTGITRIPDTYELRVKTADGVLYTLQPSASNPKSVQPKADTELSYLSVIDRTDDVTLTEVNWTDVDVYVYPKTETVVATAPISGLIWKGSDMTITDPDALKKWSDTFTIPQITSPLRYTPVDIHKELTDKGTVYIVQLLAHNDSDKRETVPDFLIEGKTAAKVFAGSRVEQGSVVLEAGEDKYIHYAIPTDSDTQLASLNVLTTEKYAQAGAAAASLIQYNVGRLNILLPSATSGTAAPTYILGAPMTLDSRSDLVHPDLQVSMVEFHAYENDEEGNKQATAKFVLTNKSDRPMAVPVFQADLISSDGYEYAGKRQTMTTASVLPNSALTINYAFTLPASEPATTLTLKVADAITAAPYKTTLAAYTIQSQATEKGDKLSMYPFEVKVEHWDLSYLFSVATLQYSYKGKLFFDIKRENNVQVDANFPRLQFELYDNAGRLVGTSVKSLIGQGRLVSGENNITFNGTSEQFDSPLKLKVYELFTTDSGDYKRLLAEYEK